MQTGLVAIGIVTKLNKLQLDLRTLSRQYGINGGEVEPSLMVRILQDQGFKASFRKIGLDAVCRKYPLPAIVRFKAGHYGVLLKAHPEESKVLVFLAGATGVSEWTYSQLSEEITGEFLLLAFRGKGENIPFGFRWFYAEILKYKTLLAEILCASFVIQLFGLLTPLFTQIILDKVINHRSMATLDILAIAFVAIGVFELLLNLARTYIFNHTVSKIDAKLSVKLFKTLFSLPYVYFESRKVGTIISRVRELDTIRDFVCNKSISVIIDLVFSFVFLGLMLVYSIPLTCVVLGVVAVMSVLFLIATPEFRLRLERKFQMIAQSSSYLVESVTGIQTVKSLAIEGSMLSRWEDTLGKYLISNLKLTTLSASLGTICSFLQRMMTIAILFFGVKQVVANELTVGQLIAFQMVAGQFTNPMLRLVTLWNEFQQTLMAVDRLGDIMNQPPEMDSDKSVTLSKMEGQITFENIGFRYSMDSPYVLKGVSFKIKAGEIIGIIGRSGSGKSTITKLIQRLYLANEGAITIDGMDIRHLNPVWLRQNTGVVLQENYLFSGSVRENIALPQPDASMDKIIEMAKLAGAHEFITQLPQGYDTIVGERGSSLSGGQKQRIAIARALISDPKILILDEATSALDYESERIIRENLKRICQNRTVLIIAHRLSTVKQCDCILAIDQGQLVEQGTHDALMQKRGYYHYLYSQQQQDEDTQWHAAKAV